MSDGILKALMQMFAIIAGKSGNVGRDAVAMVLEGQLNTELTQRYLRFYDDYVLKFYKTADLSEKKRSMASVKVLRMCEEINEELEQQDKILVMLRLAEFVSQYKAAGEQEWEFIQTVGEVFHIPHALYQDLLEMARLQIVENALEWQHDQICIAGDKTADLLVHDLQGHLIFLRMEEAGLVLVKYLGKDVLLLNGQPIQQNRIYAFPQGSAIRGNKIHPIFYSDVLHRLLKSGPLNLLSFQVEKATYSFPNGKTALHPLTIDEHGGTLVGIMGGSGSGKSTLVNILNGNYAPKTGHIYLNGVDIYRNHGIVKSQMGYVAQDDILIEELTVFENLYFSAKLSMPQSSDEAIAQKTNDVLKAVGLWECRRLRVGNVLDKTISGGQRKRLNIALELVRESSVLFVDEPTSGLSSRDSEMIMDLLKELTLRGKLIFVVIHQPSSDIFKMFDRLLLMDQGGYPIYYGNPVESILYFKGKAKFVSLSDSQCSTCGNVNPEQLFNIIEAKIIDEYGMLTDIRKVTPKEWNGYFNLQHQPPLKIENNGQFQAERTSWKDRWKQWKTYLFRDAKSKWVNQQYMLINFLEAPLLALVLSLFVKYFPMNEKGIGEYTFRQNLNFPQYLFFAVVVALFLGLTVSAEEILKDRKILKRERYLGQSYSAYLFSKLGILFFISAVQSASFVLVGNLILDVKGMFIPFWLTLFSLSCFANALGLNISATFNSAKVIYILIPILIIPQLLFSGVIVRFDRLFPSITQQSSVPWIGDVMASRWAFEAMAVEQYTQNPYSQITFDLEMKLKYYGWKKDYWLKDIQGFIQEMRDELREGSVPQEQLTLLENEWNKEKERVSGLQIELSSLSITDTASWNVRLNQWMSAAKDLESYYVRLYNQVNQQKELRIADWMQNSERKKQFLALKDQHHNESLEDILTNKNDVERVVREGDDLIQKQNLVYIYPEHPSIFQAHFYSPMKEIGPMEVKTIWANIIVLWGMAVSMIVLLMTDGLNKMSGWINQVRSRNQN
jgi:ABC-type multidrug transport system ATPase subunit